MGLRADVEEVSQIWHRSPWRVRVFLLVALFLSTSSLASLSEAVFKWKGFVLDALAFYRLHVGRPLADWAALIAGHPMPADFADQAVVLGLFLGGLTRAVLLRNSSRWKRIADVSFFGLTYAVMLYMLANDATKPTEGTIGVIYPMFLLTAYLLTKGAERILAVSYMLIPALAVALLAAVSAGLAR